MARDVSAFANADGGQIIYGMTEKDHDPTGLDKGLDPKAYPEIWFEQVLQQHVTPTIAGLKLFRSTALRRRGCCYRYPRDKRRSAPD